MGFNDLNPTDNVESAVKRGDDYFVILAESDDVAFTDTIEFTTPVAGFAIGQNSDFDQCGIQFNFPNSTDAQPQTRVVSVGAPLIARMPPTGVQESPVIELITGNAGGNINLIRPTDQATTDGDGFPILELYVYLRNPTAIPPMRRRDRIVENTEAAATGVETTIASLYAFGRKEFSAQVMIDAAAGGTLRVYQRSLTNSGFTVAVTKIAEVAVAAAEQLAIEGWLHGADIVAVTFQATVNSAAAVHLEVRD